MLDEDAETFEEQMKALNSVRANWPTIATWAAGGRVSGPQLVQEFKAALRYFGVKR